MNGTEGWWRVLCYRSTNSSDVVLMAECRLTNCYVPAQQRGITLLLLFLLLSRTSPPPLSSFYSAPPHLSSILPLSPAVSRIHRPLRVTLHSFSSVAPDNWRSYTLVALATVMPTAMGTHSLVLYIWVLLS